MWCPVIIQPIQMPLHVQKTTIYKETTRFDYSKRVCSFNRTGILLLGRKIDASQKLGLVHYTRYMVANYQQCIEPHSIVHVYV